MLAILGVLASAQAADVTANRVDCASARPDVEIGVYDGAFEPEGASVRDGGVVRWTNEGTMRHTVTSGRPGEPRAGRVFDSGTLEPGASYCAELRGSQPIEYFCRIHPTRMQATLDVGVPRR